MVDLVGEVRDWSALVGSAPSRGVEVDPVGLSVDIEQALADTSSFRHISQRIDDGVVRVEVEWCGSGTTLADVDRDFYDMYGRVAEESQFIRRRVAGDAVVFHVVSGCLGDATEHVHFCVLRVVGVRARRAIETTRRIQAELPEDGASRTHPTG